MNLKQRNKNRSTARALRQPLCPECGKPGPHFVPAPGSLKVLFDGADLGGFWLCDKFYGADGRRLPEHTKTNEDDVMAVASLWLRAEALRSNEQNTTEQTP